MRRLVCDDSDPCYFGSTDAPETGVDVILAHAHSPVLAGPRARVHHPVVAPDAAADRGAIAIVPAELRAVSRMNDGDSINERIAAIEISIELR